MTQSAILELLKAGKEAELNELYMNWSIQSDLRKLVGQLNIHMAVMAAGWAGTVSIFSINL